MFDAIGHYHNASNGWLKCRQNSGNIFSFGDLRNPNELWDYTCAAKGNYQAKGQNVKYDAIANRAHLSPSTVGSFRGNIGQPRPFSSGNSVTKFSGANKSQRNPPGRIRAVSHVGFTKSVIPSSPANLGSSQSGIRAMNGNIPRPVAAIPSYTPGSTTVSSFSAAPSGATSFSGGMHPSTGGHAHPSNVPLQGSIGKQGSDLRPSVGSSASAAGNSNSQSRSIPTQTWPRSTSGPGTAGVATQQPGNQLPSQSATVPSPDIGVSGFGPASAASPAGSVNISSVSIQANVGGSGTVMSGIGAQTGTTGGIPGVSAAPSSGIAYSNSAVASTTSSISGASAAPLTSAPLTSAPASTAGVLSNSASSINAAGPVHVGPGTQVGTLGGTASTASASAAGVSRGNFAVGAGGPPAASAPGVTAAPSPLGSAPTGTTVAGAGSGPMPVAGPSPVLPTTSGTLPLATGSIGPGVSAAGGVGVQQSIAVHNSAAGVSSQVAGTVTSATQSVPASGAPPAMPSTGIMPASVPISAATTSAQAAATAPPAAGALPSGTKTFASQAPLQVAGGTTSAPAPTPGTATLPNVAATPTFAAAPAGYNPVPTSGGAGPGQPPAVVAPPLSQPVPASPIAAAPRLPVTVPVPASSTSSAGSAAVGSASSSSVPAGSVAIPSSVPVAGSATQAVLPTVTQPSASSVATSAASFASPTAGLPPAMAPAPQAASGQSASAASAMTASTVQAPMTAPVSSRAPAGAVQPAPANFAATGVSGAPGPTAPGSSGLPGSWPGTAQNPSAAQVPGLAAQMEVNGGLVSGGQLPKFRGPGPTPWSQPPLSVPTPRDATPATSSGDSIGGGATSVVPLDHPPGIVSGDVNRQLGITW